MADKGKIKRKYNYTKKTGRPTKTLKDLPENWKDIVILKSIQGFSEQEIRRDICLSYGKEVKCIIQLWYKLQDREVEFKQTLKIGKVFCEAWWVAASRNNLFHAKDSVFETGSWFANMKNRFGWKDKSEIDHGITDEAYEKYKDLSINQIHERLNVLTGPVYDISATANN